MLLLFYRHTGVNSSENGSKAGATSTNSLFHAVCSHLARRVRNRVSSVENNFTVYGTLIIYVSRLLPDCACFMDLRQYTRPHGNVENDEQHWTLSEWYVPLYYSYMKFHPPTYIIFSFFFFLNFFHPNRNFLFKNFRKNFPTGHSCRPTRTAKAIGDANFEQFLILIPNRLIPILVKN